MVDLYFKEGFLDAFDKLQLFYWRLKPEEPKAILCLIHGAGEHSGRYADIGKYFFERSFAVYAIDYRGHGRSQGKRGDVKSFDEYLLDIDELVQLARKELPGKKLFILGHSLGGLISSLYTIKYEELIAGLILISPAFKITLEIPAVKKVLGKLLHDIIPSLTMDNEIDPYILTHDYATIKKYKEDRLIHYRVSLRLYREARVAMVRARKYAKDIRIPLLVMQGGDDKLICPKTNEYFFKKASSQDKQFKLYEGYYHELLNEVGKDKVIAEIEEWLNKRI